MEIYRAQTVDLAQRLADVLEQAGVEAFVETTEDPMYGMSQGPAGRRVMVRKAVAEHARPVVEKFRVDWHPDEDAELFASREPSGLEQPKPEKPSDESPRDSILDKTPGYTEQLDEAGVNQPTSPEQEAVRDPANPDRPIAPDIDTDRRE